VSGGLDVRAAFYGHLFREAGAMGASARDLPADERVWAEALAEEWLRRAEGSDLEEQRRVAREELAGLGLVKAGEAQGVRSVRRSIVARLAQLPFFAGVGMGLAERFVVRALRQVTQYLTDDAVRAAAQQAVRDLVDGRTTVIVAHSLGSVVAYEVCFSLGRPLPLLLTFGSPLGLRTIVYDRLRPNPAVFPPMVRRWVNVADRNDLVAAEPDLGRFFGEVPSGAKFEQLTVTCGRDAHRAVSYLTAVAVGRAVGETLC
jgi:hypothetical protein